jgi:hypothetical protein
LEEKQEVVAHLHTAPMDFYTKKKLVLVVVEALEMSQEVEQ